MAKRKSKRQRQMEALGEAIGSKLREDEQRRRNMTLSQVHSVYPATPRAGAERKLKARQPFIGAVPRQRELLKKEKLRGATIRALEVAAGRPIGRRTRERLRGQVPEALREALCKKKRERRSSLFAKKVAGKGRSAKGQRPRQLTIGKC